MKIHNQVKRIPVSQEAFRNIRWYLQTHSIWFVAGINSLYIPSRQEKYLVTHNKAGQPVCKEWIDLNGEKVLMSPGEAARTELKRHFPTLTRVGWQSSHIALLDKRWPMYYGGSQQHSKGMYIDLVGAYHQIYTRLWLDTAFPCGYGSLDLMPIAERLQSWKGARNALIGVIRSRDAIGVKGFKQTHMKTRNPFLSPGLGAVIQAILNDVAFQAVKIGAIYVATDGYIFPDHRWGEYFQEKLFDWGLTFRSHTGEVHLQRWGAYRVGNKQTKNYQDGVITDVKPFDAINLSDTSFPNKHINWWAFSVNRWRNKK